MQLLTDKSKRPVLFKSARFVGFLGLAFTASMINITLIGLTIAYSAIPLVAATENLMNMNITFLNWGIIILHTLMTWVFLYFTGRFYMHATSSLGFKYRLESLTPIFIVSLIFWIPIIAYTASGMEFASLCMALGFGLNLYAQRQEMKKIRNKLSNNNLSNATSSPRIETAKKIGNDEILEQLAVIKSAESIEHLEQLSKECLMLIKPIAATQPNCTSTLIDELLKRKLHSEADELSLLQLNLSE